MKNKPLGDRVLIELIKEEKKKGGIIIADTVEKEEKEEGKVVAVGSGVTLDLKKGDIVIFKKYGSGEDDVEHIELNGKKMVVARQLGILLIKERK